MKILSLGLDNSILDETSPLAERARRYGELAEKYSVIVPADEFKKIRLSEKVMVYGSGGRSKVDKLFKLYNLAASLVNAEKYDVISVQDQYYLAFIGLRLAKKFKTGLEIQVHGFEKRAGLRKLLASYVLKRAGAVRTVSLRLKKEMMEKYGVVENMITVVPIYFPLPKAGEPISKKDQSKFIFFTAARLVPVKNIGLEIRAMKQVAEKYPNVELWIAGEGAERGKLESLAMELGLSDKVKFLGWQKDLSGSYQSADAYLLTSDAEGWGLAAIGAAAYGLPIIMTDVGLAGEVIIDGKSGIVIPVGDQRRLVEAMIRIIEDQSLRKKLSEAAFAAAGRLMSLEQTLAEYKKSWEIALRNKYL